jgi:hypothetical protein
MKQNKSEIFSLRCENSVFVAFLASEAKQKRKRSQNKMKKKRNKKILEAKYALFILL